MTAAPCTTLSTLGDAPLYARCPDCAHAVAAHVLELVVDPTGETTGTAVGVCSICDLRSELVNTTPTPRGGPGGSGASIGVPIDLGADLPRTFDDVPFPGFDGTVPEPPDDTTDRPHPPELPAREVL